MSNREYASLAGFSVAVASSLAYIFYKGAVQSPKAKKSNILLENTEQNNSESINTEEIILSPKPNFNNLMN